MDKRSSKTNEENSSQRLIYTSRPFIAKKPIIFSKYNEPSQWMSKLRVSL